MTDFSKFVIEVGATAADIASATGISVQAIYKYLRGRVPRVAHMAKIIQWSDRKLEPNSFYDMSELYMGEEKRTITNHRGILE